MAIESTGCMMCHSLYVKANGEMPCWDDVGENEILWHESPEVPAPSLFYHPKLVNIRQAFLSGAMPFPELCERCGVRGCAQNVEVRPATMEVLHLEPSYLCHLSCPQCIPASVRRSLKEPPYFMTTALLHSLLTRLKDEGVSNIHFTHFEGRGDPLLNRELPALTRMVKEFFPRTVTGITTHGSYAFQDWISGGDLDYLRVSIDGARAESYSRYRVGGDFNRAMRFLRDVKEARNREGVLPAVEWKYILFEWNDSDSEIVEAGRLAQEFDARLVFVMTHSPGRSIRFTLLSDAQRAITGLVPHARLEQTYQLRATSERLVDGWAFVMSRVEDLMLSCMESIRRADEPRATQFLKCALGHDPGLRCTCDHDTPEDLLYSHLDLILRCALAPATLSWTAAICREYRHHQASTLLLKRYLEIAPNAPDFDHVSQDILISEEALRERSAVRQSAMAWE